MADVELGSRIFLTPVCCISDSEPVFVNVEGAQELIPPAYVAYSGPVRQLGGLSYQAGNRFLVSLKGLQIRALVTLLLSCELLFPMFSK